MAPPAPKLEWLCRSCKGRDGKAFRNHGTRTTCFKCRVAKGACFAGAVGDGRGCPSVSSAEKQKLAARDKEVRDLKSQLKAVEAAAAEGTRKLRTELEDLKKTSGAAHVVGVDGGALPRDDAYKRVCADVKRLRGAGDDEFRRRFGLDTQLANLEREKAKLERARRDGKPTDEHLTQSQAYEARLLGDIEEAKAAGEDLARRQRELDYEKTKHDERMDLLTGKLDEVRAEIAVCLAGLAKEKSPPAATGTGDVGKAAASSVETFFAALEPQVAAHPEGQQHIRDIKQKLDELLAASEAARAAVEAPAAPTQVDAPSQPGMPETPAGPAVVAPAPAGAGPPADGTNDAQMDRIIDEPDPGKRRTMFDDLRRERREARSPSPGRGRPARHGQ